MAISLQKKARPFLSWRRWKTFPKQETDGTGAGMQLMVDLKKIERGSYILSVLSAEGEVIRNEEVGVGSAILRRSIGLPHLQSGTYYINLFNTSTGRSYTSEFNCS